MNTRIVYKEMRRAVYEGFRHQLWAFLLGDKGTKPAPAMMTKLINDVTGMSGERTGNLCLWGALRIEVHTPKTDNLMSAEEWWMLNLDTFRLPNQPAPMVSINNKIKFPTVTETLVVERNAEGQAQKIVEMVKKGDK